MSSTYTLSQLLPSGRDLVQRQLDVLTVLTRITESLIRLQKIFVDSPHRYLVHYRVKQSIRETRLACSEIWSNLYDIMDMSSRVCWEAGKFRGKEVVDLTYVHHVLERANGIVRTLRAALPRQHARIESFHTTWARLAKASLTIPPPAVPSSRFRLLPFVKCRDPNAEAKLLLARDVSDAVSAVNRELGTLEQRFQELEEYWSLWAQDTTSSSSGVMIIEFDKAWMDLEWGVEGRLNSCVDDARRNLRSLNTETPQLLYPID